MKGKPDVCSSVLTSLAFNPLHAYPSSQVTLQLASLSYQKIQHCGKSS